MKPRMLHILLILSFLLPLTQNSNAQTVASPGLPGQLAYIGVDGNVWIQLEDSGEQIAVTADASPERKYLSPRWSPDGQKLAYCQKDSAEPGGYLHLVRAGEWLPILLAQDVHCREWPQGSFNWSPDGSKIVFGRLGTEDGKKGIWEVDFLNGGQRLLVASPGDGQLLFPEFSPNGEWLRMYEPLYLEGLGVLRTWHGNGSGLLNWLELSGDLFPGFSSWSPDGSRLVFDEVTYLGFPGAGLYTAAPDGNGLQKILSRSDEAAERPLWSPRGDLIAFQLTSPVVSAYPGVRLGLVDSSGNGYRELYRSEQKLDAITWSEDGSTLIVGEAAGDQVQLLAFDVAAGTSRQVLLMGGWDLSWSEKPLILDIVKDEAPVQVADFPYRDDLLLYLASDYRLVLASPSEGKSVDLSQPMTVAGFFVSPSRQRILTFGRLLSVDFQEDGSLQIQQGTLPQQAVGWQVRWSPDESQVAYQDRSEGIWIARLNGSAIQLNGAAGLPEWSADSQWLSYCDAQSNLWLVGGDRPAEIIASDTRCDQRWSSRESVLAFTGDSGGKEPATSAYLYDTVSRTLESLLPDAAFHSWSPDGRLAALRQEGRQAGRYTIFVLDPVSNRQLALGQFEENTLGNTGWMPASVGYQFGPYRIPEDLRASSKIADLIFDSTPAGDRMLVAVGEREIVTLACLAEGEGLQQLFTVGLSTPEELHMQAVSGKISPTGEWVAVQTYDKNGIVYLLAHCQDGRRIPLPSGVDAQQGEFSRNGAWFVQPVQGDVGAGKSLIYDLSSGISSTITTVHGAPSFWLGLLPGEVAQATGAGRVSGQLSGPQQIPLPGVEIFVDGRFAGVTDVAGRYLITGLPEGSYKIEPRLQDWTFDPVTRSVRTPPDVSDIDFEGVAPQSVQSSTRQNGSALPEQSATPTPEITTASGEEEMPDLMPWLEAAWGKVLSWYGVLRENWPGIASGIRDLPLEVSLGVTVLALLILVLVTRRRRVVVLARAKPQPLEQTEIPIEDTQPTRAVLQGDGLEQVLVENPLAEKLSPVEETLNRGAEQVKQGSLEDGIASLRKVLEIEPENRRAWMWLGWAAVRQNDRRAAERFFRQADRLGHPKAREALDWLRK